MIGVSKRNKGLNKANYSTQELYNNYISNIERGTVYEISKVIHSSILKEFNTIIMKMIMEKNLEFILPHRCGNLRIKTKKLKLELDEEGNLITRKLPVNYPATKELWNNNPKAYEERKLVFYTNEHNDEEKPFFYWNKKRCNFTNQYYKSFIPTRTNKRDLARVIKDPNIKVKYYE